MSYRALLEGGPLDGTALKLVIVGQGPPDWPGKINDTERTAAGHYVLADREPVPFALGAHPNVLLTATYRWSQLPDSPRPGLPSGADQ